MGSKKTYILCVDLVIHVCRLEHLYREPGAFIVVARCDYGEHNLVAMTAVAVQQMITSVILIGPETLFKSRSADQFVLVHVFMCPLDLFVCSLCFC